MYKFAHIADCHIGAQKYPELKELELKAFNVCIDECIKENVDFIIIAGDLFHSNIPNMDVVKETVGKLREVKEMGIPIYMSYGSHDFSPNQTSIIDVITESGLLKNIAQGEIIGDNIDDEKLKLNFTIDPVTKAKITGIYGRKNGIEKHYFEILDRDTLENEEGFKIFVFHTSIEDLIPKFLSKMEGVPLHYFPIGFNYYAGGHIHKNIIEEKMEDFGPIIYPGPLFAGDMRDLESNAKGGKEGKRGFYIVEFDDKNIYPKFNEIKLADYEFLPFDANTKTSYQLNEEIIEKVTNNDYNGKIVIMKVKGHLVSGKTSDIDFNKIREILRNNGVLYIGINHHSLVSKEFAEVRLEGETNEEIEENLLKENIINAKVNYESLQGEKGATLALNLIDIIKESQKPNEKKSDYTNRILNNALELLDIEGTIDDI
ncbi:MAG: DNA repair exonuclease [Methanobacterium sp.]